MRYNIFEDAAIEFLCQTYLKKDQRPSWHKITKLMNAFRHYLISDDCTKPAYTEAMLRNRYQRLHNFAKRKYRNFCNRCGRLIRGHSCSSYEYTHITIKCAPHSRTSTPYTFVQSLLKFALDDDSDQDTHRNDDDIELESSTQEDILDDILFREYMDILSTPNEVCTSTLNDEVFDDSTFETVE